MQSLLKILFTLFLLYLPATCFSQSEQDMLAGITNNNFTYSQMHTQYKGKNIDPRIVSGQVEDLNQQGFILSYTYLSGLSKDNLNKYMDEANQFYEEINCNSDPDPLFCKALNNRGYYLNYRMAILISQGNNIYAIKYRFEQEKFFEANSNMFIQSL